MISVRNLSKVFDGVPVLKEISVDIRKGEVVAIIGPSGTGKSTFLRCLNLLERPSGGSILIDGIDILHRGADIAKIRQRMNMVFQSFNLFAHLTALENLTLGPVKLRGVARQEAEGKAMELLRLVGLAEKAESFPDELSGGQKQRVAIARCLAMEPEIILFDEPTSALDPTMICEVLAVIRRLAGEGMTMAIVTHELDFARDVAHRVLYLDEGLVYEEGTPEQIFENPHREKTRAFVNRSRSLSFHLDNPDFDLYGIQGEFETFCEKQIIPKASRDRLLLLMEELLLIYAPRLRETPICLTLTHSEKKELLELVVESEEASESPLDSRLLPDDIGLRIIRGLSKGIDYRTIGGKNRLTVTIGKG